MSLIDQQQVLPTNQTVGGILHMPEHKRLEFLERIASELIAQREAEQQDGDDERLRATLPWVEGAFSSPAERILALADAMEVELKNPQITEVTPANLMGLLVLHTSSEDVPNGTKPRTLALGADRILGQMADGRRVLSYSIEWSPEWIRKGRGEFMPEAPEGWMSAAEVGAYKEISERTVKEYCNKREPAAEEGTVEEYCNERKPEGETRLTAKKYKYREWYVKQDAKLDYWITRTGDWALVCRRLDLLSEALSMGLGWDQVELDEQNIPKYGAFTYLSARQYVERSLEDEGIPVPETDEDWLDAIPNIYDYAAERKYQPPELNANDR